MEGDRYERMDNGDEWKEKMTVLTGPEQQENDLKLDLTERIESVKAGFCSGLVVAVSFAIGVLVNRYGLTFWFKELLPLAHLNTWDLFLSLVLAAFSGFLFGITYRYVIRQDQNPHLRSGAVLAFGLVRGVAQVDTGLQHHSPLLPLIVLAGESVLLFAFARLALDWAIAHRLIRPFGSNHLPE